MRREDIANFLNAERRISPLTAFSLLIAAGFFAGSLQLVAPTQSSTIAMLGNVESSLDTDAPESCTDAIDKALGKQADPEATTVGEGQESTADKCFGAVLQPGKQPSQKKEDYM